jgi:hypothetical protein
MATITIDAARSSALETARLLSSLLLLSRP